MPACCSSLVVFESDVGGRMGAEAMLRRLVVARAGGAGKASSGHMPGPGGGRL